jgi:hypothetical protein
MALSVVAARGDARVGGVPRRGVQLWLKTAVLSCGWIHGGLGLVGMRSNTMQMGRRINGPYVGVPVAACGCGQPRPGPLQLPASRMNV